jgi:hypothetical protein
VRSRKEEKQSGGGYDAAALALCGRNDEEDSMSENSEPTLQVVHVAPGRMRIRINTPQGQGHLHRLKDELHRMPETQSVRANHTARSVTVSYDPDSASVPALVGRLCTLGVAALHSDPAAGLTELVLDKMSVRVHDPTTYSGRMNRKLMTASKGQVDLFRTLSWLLVLGATLDAGFALSRGTAIMWRRIAAFLLAALATRLASDVPAMGQGNSLLDRRP